ncbi:MULTISPECIES: Vi polysaccharide biosynthesis UDP-N-acetylglucosamine C-6 dehydrogenase TviB [unclassified Leisingera]|uniref:Vi polysaccharide biosynthesis UDP-N-acetylglucosamine C-6 dehydrogenase TviB n=1 Tax=unclassified Leisingera TaxID=2614906 RepID=UPI00030DF6E6|nr:MULTISPECIES: Vi polysaccharide biosynthesis UDP-N-acetylglucosamine C-6 dehydrogenase TviB [unclassified Leisingera]KIC21944.1 Vi polysaccharide biosynthesis protein VipA/TviB [Leisingera sp. ANG-S3]KIC50267.1 Vi polysaccharide biosynthesis protein VipA/TviB [Leisingera sp. ANG-S]KID07631.1 Vi polysaccharide biosynthesis protein VipA/TviB [Leisingera sp. ANG1]
MSGAQDKICVIGLGYVGLPLAAAFGQHRAVMGFDIDPSRIAELRKGADRTRELEPEELAAAEFLRFTSDPAEIADCSIYIVTVPTPVDASHRPDLGPLLAASAIVGSVLKPGDLVIYESTVYPGATEEDCVPVLEARSGLKFNADFFAGYSPERINPGDKKRRLKDVVKVTSGSTSEVAERVDALYREVVTAGTHKAASIRVAEAAKVIENSQRDINIALVNELAKIFNRMGIDTQAVLEAAGTKWNFLPFRPGLVGGHCIGVDPYYLTHKAEQLGYHPEILLAGRRLNDGMGAYAAGEMVKAMLKRSLPVAGARVLVMGLTFKENCPDLRNTRVIDVVRSLEEYGAVVDVFDPHADPAEAQEEYGIPLVSEPGQGGYAGVVLAVAHSEFRAMGAQAIRALGSEGALLYDLKYVLAPDEADLRL